MKRLLIAAGITAAILAPAGVAAAHNTFVRCVTQGAHAGRLWYHADSYNTGVRTIDGGTPAPFTGGFSVVLAGNVVEHITITAPDWPTFTGSAGPCVQPTTTTVRPTTTTVRPTTTTTGVPSSPPTTAAAPSTSSSSAPTTTAPSAPSSTQPPPTSTAPTPPPSSVLPAATALPSVPGTSATPGPTPSAPAVDQLPVTGSSSGPIAAIAAAFVLAGAAALIARRRAS